MLSGELALEPGIASGNSDLAVLPIDLKLSRSDSRDSRREAELLTAESVEVLLSRELLRCSVRSSCLTSRWCFA